ncbi:subtilisin-like protein [Lenzites betulinus]|nr:subtilisin-like protein [Lenzites betulinus]
MLFLSSVFCLVGVAVSVLGSPEPQLSRRVLHEYRRSLPSGWSLHRRADPGATLPLSIALAQSNIHSLEDYLLDIADPESPNYGKHWTPAQVREKFRPSQESIDVVHAWLATDGVHPERVQLSHDGAYVRVNVSISEAERLLATEYYVYQHEDGSEDVACEHGYHLPEHVAKHVDLVRPTIQVRGAKASSASLQKRGSVKGARSRRPMNPSKGSSSTGKATGCDTQVTLDCIRDLYDFHYTLQVPELNSVAVVELGDQNYNGRDLDFFFKKFAPGRVGDRPTFVSIDGGVEDMSESDGDLIGEANLDFCLVMGLLDPSQEVLLYQIGDGFVDDMLSVFDVGYCKEVNGTTCASKPQANVVSISYGNSELDASVPEMIRQCNEMGKISLTGVTFVYASGDDGPSVSGQCLGPDGTAVDGVGNFLADFPGTCQYLTAVGSTQVNPGNTTSDPESATATFASGAGFSTVFARPRFQSHAVKKYLNNFVPDALGAGVFNRSGRAYPDMAANGHNIAIGDGGAIGLEDGTSASAPIFAAMVTAINDARIAAGKGPVGWINPAIYSRLFAGAWTDITDGTNPGCGTDGFTTSPGWDPVTGLGTPNFPRLLQRFLALP